MSRKIQQRLAVLCAVSLLSACAELPLIGKLGRSGSEKATAKAETTTESEKTAAKETAADKPSTDEAVSAATAPAKATAEERSASSASAADKKSVARSQDVVVADTAKAKARGKRGKRVGSPAEAKVSVVLSPQPGAARLAIAPPVVQPPPVLVESSEPVVIPKRATKSKSARRGAKIKSAATSRAARRAAASNRKGKRRAVVIKNLWDRVRARPALIEIEHPRIDEQIAYLKRNPGYLNLLAQRSRPFLHYILGEIDQRSLPTDLALLPMVESGFEPTAISTKAAAGLWQIIPSTGQEWGLVIVEGYDGRFDIHTSTGVALGYLRYLNKLFKGDWLLTLAAYNAGPGAVRAAIEVDNREQAQAAAAAKKLAEAQAAAAAQAAAQAAAAQAAAAQAAAAQAAAAQAAAAQDTTSLPAPFINPTPDVASEALPNVIGLLPATPIPTPAATPRAGKVAALAQKKVPAVPQPPVAASDILPPPPPKPEAVFWRLKLPKETRDYVPRILALARIVTNPNAYGVRLPTLGNQPYLFRVDVNPEFKITDGLVASGLPSEEFFRFNPGFKPGIDPPPRAYNLLLPLEQARNLAISIPGVQLAAARKHTVKKGETLATIAKRLGIPSMQLAQWNNLNADTVLEPGQQLVIYPSS